MPKVVFVNEKKEIEVPAGSNLRQAAIAVGIPIYKGLDRYLNCRGLGMCGTCRVLITEGMENMNTKTLRERLNFNLHPLGMFAAIGHEDQIRLSCQVRVDGDCKVQTQPAFNWSGDNFWQKPYPNK